MNNISLSLKITVAFIIVSVISVLFMFVTFSELFERNMRKTESEKVTLIAETIEPMIAMNMYLGLVEESKSIAQQLVNRKHVLKSEMAAVIAEDARIHASALKDVQSFWGQDSAET